MNLLKEYQEKIRPKLLVEMKAKNIMAVPKVVKVVVNVGVKEALVDKKVLDHVSEQLAAICGQRPVTNKAKISIAAFKLRQGDPVGVSVTLRGIKMYDFLAKLITVVLPRVRDFRGIKLTAFDKQGNYTLGIIEQIVFPEIDYDKIDRVRGLEIVIVTTAKSSEEGLTLLRALGFPFEK